MKEIKNTEEAVDAAFIEREKKQFEKMTKTPIPKLVIGLGIPTMLSMMITSLYNLADTYFVSLIGEDSITAAASNLLALMSIIQAIGFTFGMAAGAWFPVCWVKGTARARTPSFPRPFSWVRFAER